jgi:hypothetical protein
MIWRTPGGLAHRQEIGQRCTTCDLYHRIAEAAVDQVCCGPAHTWASRIRPTIPCVFCGLSWRLIQLPGDLVYTPIFSVPAPLEGARA